MTYQMTALGPDGSVFVAPITELPERRLLDRTARDLRTTIEIRYGDRIVMRSGERPAPRADGIRVTDIVGGYDRGVHVMIAPRSIDRRYLAEQIRREFPHPRGYACECTHDCCGCTIAYPVSVRIAGSLIRISQRVARNV